MKQFRILLFTSVLFLFSLVTFSQTLDNISIQFGPTLKIPSYHTLNLKNFIGIDQSYIYGIEYWSDLRSDGTHLVRFNKNSLEDIERTDFKNERGVHTYLQTKDAIYLFSVDKYVSENKIVLLAQRINKNSFGLSPDLIEVAEVDILPGMENGKFDFSCSQSPNGEKCLFVFRQVDNVTTAHGSIILVTGSDLQTEWEKKIEDPPLKPSFIEQGKINDDGDVYLLFKRFNNLNDFNTFIKLKTYTHAKDIALGENGDTIGQQDGKIVMESNYEYEITSLQNYGKLVKGISFHKKGLFISNLKFGLQDTTNLVLAGLYSKEGKVSVVGCVSFKLDLSNDSILKENWIPFSRSFISQGMSIKDTLRLAKRIASGDNFDKDAYDLHDIVFNENKTFSLVAEHHAREIHIEHFGQNYHHQLPAYRDRYKDILICNFNRDGDLLWNRKILKNQAIKSDYRDYGSYYLLHSENSLYFLVNKFKDFPEFRNGLTPMPITNSLMAVDSAGNISTKDLFDWSDGKKIIMPGISKQLTSKEVYFYGSNGNNYNLTKINIK